MLAGAALSGFPTASEVVALRLLERFRPLLPAPLLTLPTARRGASHRLRRRAVQRREVALEANALLRTLNSLSRGECRPRTTHRWRRVCADPNRPVDAAVQALHAAMLEEAAIAVKVRRGVASPGLSGAQVTASLVKAEA